MFSASGGDPAALVATVGAALDAEPRQGLTHRPGGPGRDRGHAGAR